MDDLGDAGAACLSAARGLIPHLQGAADRIEARNELPPDVLDAMFGAGMFTLLLPRAFGGFELKPTDYIQRVEAIAEGDASAAWCMNQGSGCSMASAYMAPDVAQEIWSGKRDVVAWGQGPGAKAVRTDGGWRVAGTWSFASGSRHATCWGR
jgi:alkylation response protein AidB-like acyl-CoA dehydrogenase